MILQQYNLGLNRVVYTQCIRLWASKEGSKKKSKTKSPQVATSPDSQGSFASALPADPLLFTPEEEQRYQRQFENNH